jgi:hypothetical protein
MIEAGISVLEEYEEYIGASAEVGLLNTERPSAVRSIFLEMYRQANREKYNR